MCNIACRNIVNGLSSLMRGGSCQIGRFLPQQTTTSINTKTNTNNASYRRLAQRPCTLECWTNGKNNCDCVRPKAGACQLPAKPAQPSYYCAKPAVTIKQTPEASTCCCGKTSPPCCDAKYATVKKSCCCKAAAQATNVSCPPIYNPKEMSILSKELHSKACCEEPCAIPLEYMCILTEVAKQYCKLVQRHDKMVTHKKCICRLAKPKWCTPKYQHDCFCVDVARRNRVQIVRKDIEPKNTRTQQLSYPSVRRLLELRQSGGFEQFDAIRKDSVNRMIRKSLYSMYSHLSNVQPPAQKPKVEKWTDKDWEEHRKRIDILIQGKRSTKSSYKAQGQSHSVSSKIKRKPKHQVRKSMMIRSSMMSLQPNKNANFYAKIIMRLAKPRSYPEEKPVEWKLTNAMKTYTPSMRILKLSKPFKRVDKNVKENPFQVSEDALNYRASKRIRELAATSDSVRVRHSIRRSTPFKVSPYALKAKASPRTEELASPKDYFENNTRANPFSISKAALKAKASPRILQLAVPKPKTN